MLWQSRWVRHAFDNFLEYRPLIPREGNKVTFAPQGDTNILEQIKEFTKNLQPPTLAPGDTDVDCLAAEMIEFKILADDKDVLPITDAVMEERLGHLVTKPDARWKYHHNAQAMLVLVKKHSLHKCFSKVREAIWRQTKDLAHDRPVHPDRAGHNPLQCFTPVPTKLLQGRFGFFLVQKTACKLTSTDFVARTPGQWKGLTEIVCRKEMINYWIGTSRVETIDPEDEKIMQDQTLLCYFSPFSSLLFDSGGADHGESTSLADAYLRTDVSQFIMRVNRTTEVLEGESSWLCHGSEFSTEVRVKDTSSTKILTSSSTIWAWCWFLTT
jgi:hypothetical protein